MLTLRKMQAIRMVGGRPSEIAPEFDACSSLVHHSVHSVSSQGTIHSEVKSALHWTSLEIVM